ncbi:MAG: YesL family protein [Ruminococcus sp.]|uniref:YesL family protein n=1 Tax=Ruminococcus sp. TaxID=41978 RepID=UPI0028734CCA|nr:DUF624 domain-containing protein [Ruminococcus sp.]MBQ3286053.1 YesL family protein [Ruminococcus sp.]
MKKIFRSDSPVMRALTIAADLLILNLLTLLLSLPLVTMGPAVTAMNDIVIHIVRGEEGYTVKPYFQSFKANFKHGVLMSLILVISAAVLYVDYLLATALIPIMRVPIIAIGLIILAIAFYAFGMLARYENTFRGTLKNAALLAVGFFPRTLFMVICTVGLWVVCIHFYKIGLPVLLLFGISLPCYVNILLLNGVFRKLDGDEEDEEEGDEKGSKFWKSFYRKTK